MKLTYSSSNSEKGSALFGYLFIALIVVVTITAIGSYVVQNVYSGQRRQDMVKAIQFSQGGAAIACKDLNRAYTNGGDIFAYLKSSAGGAYNKNNSLSDHKTVVYERTLAGASSPFTNQSVLARLWMDKSGDLTSAKIEAIAKVGNTTQTAEIFVETQFTGAAILSTNPGNSSTGADKGNAKTGNVAVNGGSGMTKIDGGILANGTASTNDCLVDAISDSNQGTSSQIPDYTEPGSLIQLFDFNRFIAAADKAKTHYTNGAAFEEAAGPGAVLEGIIVVDIPKTGAQPTLSPSKFPRGINVHGTLVFNFTGDWDPLDKIVNTATMNINAATNMSGFVAGNPATYPTGYPPVYTNNLLHNPTNIAFNPAKDRFTAQDDLPALMYNNAILDMHGDVNICGAVYSSSFMEIENKSGGQTQYFKGCLIGGGGIYVENNNSDSTTVVSYDPRAVRNLATAGLRGKTVVVVFRK